MKKILTPILIGYFAIGSILSFPMALSYVYAQWFVLINMGWSVFSISGLGFIMMSGYLIVFSPMIRAVLWLPSLIMWFWPMSSARWCEWTLKCRTPLVFWPRYGPVEPCPWVLTIICWRRSMVTNIPWDWVIDSRMWSSWPISGAKKPVWKGTWTWRQTYHSVITSRSSEIWISITIRSHRANDWCP